jgi:gamma-glutamyltranspeptidase / glutathione hydrolase
VIADVAVKHALSRASTSMPPFSLDPAGRVQRSPIFGRQVVATSSPAAAQVGLSVMEHGGNAIDAAVAVAATLSVVEPTMNGVGGDLFALIWDGLELHGLNASGRSPRAWSFERFAARGAIPELGWDAVTVPGAVSGWVALHQRFGSRPFAELLRPAIGYAREGFPVLPKMAALWAEAPARFADFAEFRRVFLPGGRAPRAGELFQLPDLARSLEQIAETRGQALYSGELGARMARAAREAGGALTLGDLEEHEPRFVEPIAVDFHGARVYEPPPNGQGLAALIALGILRHLPLARLGPEHPDAVHFQLEAMKLAFADCARHVADPARMRISTEELLSEVRLAELAERLSASRVAAPLPGPRPDHGTVYATTADREGRMVSLIQSNYLGFGSGVVVPHTGISLQNRGLGFSLDPDHPNRLSGGALPYHTIMPGMLLEGGQARMSFGVMGGHMQPQGHVQLVLRTKLFGQEPQAACDASRWYVAPDGKVALEPELESAVGWNLLARGHTLMPSPPTILFGGAQLICKLGSFYCAGSDPRKDGQAVGC